MKKRNAVVEGQFYPGTKKALEKMVEALTKKSAGKKAAIGAVSPHAGYVYSGEIAGSVLGRLASRDLFIIIGPNHTGIGEPFSIYPEGAWKTLLGEVEIDAGAAGKLISASPIFKADESAHAYEHSIEVQLPFLQYLFKGFKFLPICVGSMVPSRLKEAGLAIAELVKGIPGDATIIASSDMTHYESHDVASEKDKKAIAAILELDEDRLLKTVSEMDISMCGVSPVTMMISAAKELGAREAELVMYKTSGETSGDYSSVVGYGGVIIR